MKNLTVIFFLLFFILSGFTKSMFAQSPEGIIYQAEARDDKGKIIFRKTLDVKVTIHQDNVTGSIVLEEVHTVTTDDYGVFVIVIGSGSSNYLLENIDWGNHSHFLNVQVKDPKTLQFVDMGTTQLLSVPYALHSKTAAEAFTADYNNLSNTPSNVSDFTNDAGYLTINDNIDVDPANEIQDLQLVNNSLSITKNGNATLIDMSAYLDDTDTHLSEIEVDAMVENNGYQLEVEDGDTDAENEFQNLNINGHDLTITNGNTIILPDNVDDADSNPTNEIQNLSSVLTEGNDGGAKQIKNILNPTAAQDAATKAYVDILKKRVEEMEEMLIEKGLFTIFDIDSNAYSVVKVGSQLWMAENLKTTKYNDGTDIPLVTDRTEWGDLTTPGYSWYANDQTTYGNTYGALYNWYAVNVDNLCPVGWHVPTDAEWSTMENYLIANGYNYDGTTDGDRDTNNKIAKALASTTFWLSSPITGSVGNTDYPEYRNKSGFSALPGGTRTKYRTGEFSTEIGMWWTKTEASSTSVWFRSIASSASYVQRYSARKWNGMSVRCIRD